MYRGRSALGISAGGRRPFADACCELCPHERRRREGAPVDAEMIDCFERFRGAVQVHQAQHDDPATRHGELTRGADDIVRARLELFSCLVRHGWAPPDLTRQQMDLDQRLVGQADDSQYA